MSYSPPDLIDDINQILIDVGWITEAEVAATNDNRELAALWEDAIRRADSELCNLRSLNY